MLWVDHDQLEHVVEATCAALLRCKDAQGLLVAPRPAMSSVEAAVLGMLTMLMHAPVVPAGTQYVLPLPRFPLSLLEEEDPDV